MKTSNERTKCILIKLASVECYVNVAEEYISRVKMFCHKIWLLRKINNRLKYEKKFKTYLQATLPFRTIFTFMATKWMMVTNDVPQHEHGKLHITY